MQTLPPQADTDQVLFHGGAPGLKVGDKILPASTTGTERTTSVDGTAAFVGLVDRYDYVFATPDLILAGFYAATYPDGAIYEVVPHSPVSPDPDCAPGESWQSPAATILRVAHPRMVFPRRPISVEEIEKVFGPDTFMSGRIVDLLDAEDLIVTASAAGSTAAELARGIWAPLGGGAHTAKAPAAHIGCG